ncbi:LytR/AlgR family response regulator transcription factor [Sediminibacterium goheungense]|uniref:LytTR family two component transcriptional regulator n=1 Tax=Sediminibacterium goheungense TaxID=1086393 RepID=A0A4R6IV10_9BACT|nr:LytTR family DNA-binding domain-containing protein [Sediminibacterium goheungense]TDO26442.1 LytTR family two component transcriptional regulator [Sediminibacterium goheungense]
MRKFKCLIIEDEPLAAEIITEYIQQVPHLQLVSVCVNAMEGLQLLKTETIDILFLDINLPQISGIDFMRSLVKKPAVIFITAHREYAIESYELGVIDYLLKPVSFSRFLMAVNKITERITVGDAVETQSQYKDYLFVNVSRKRQKIHFDEIIYFESKREYVNIVTQQGSYLTKIQLSELEKQLSADVFLRIHRSFIISKRKIKAYNTTEIDLAAVQVPIGRNYKEHVLAQLNQS